MRPLLSCLLSFSLSALAAEKPTTQPTTRPLTIRIPDTTVTFDLIQLPQGQVTLKDKDGKETTHKIKPIWIGKTEVTWDEVDVLILEATAKRRDEKLNYFDAAIRPSELQPYFNMDRGFGHEGWPVGSVSFLTASAYCKWLSQKTGHKYRLPTEAEWEYACRAGGPPLQPEKKALTDIAWFDQNSDDQTHHVAEKKPNPWGLYDTLGNVAEWVTRDNQEPAIAGGSFQDQAKDLHSGAREPYSPNWQRSDPKLPKERVWLSDAPHAGFRLVRED